MSDKQDLTPQERVDDALLARILGTDCGCNGMREHAKHDVSVATGAYVDARMEHGSCGTCGCAHDVDKGVCGFGIESGILASVYAPMQRFEGVYDVKTAMRRGTMFEGLDKPFYGDGREIDCRGRER